MTGQSVFDGGDSDHLKALRAIFEADQGGIGEADYAEVEGLDLLDFDPAYAVEKANEAFRGYTEALDTLSGCLDTMRAACWASYEAVGSPYGREEADFLRWVDEKANAARTARVVPLWLA